MKLKEYIQNLIKLVKFNKKNDIPLNGTTFFIYVGNYEMPHRAGGQFLPDKAI